MGHSISLGRADAVTVIASSTAVADAAATMTCNQVQSKSDIHRALGFAQGIEGVSGVIVVVEDQVGAWGDVELVPLF